MFTRLLTFRGVTDIEAGTGYLREEVLPILESQRGFRGVSAFADGMGDLVTILSLWETEADRSASDSALGKSRNVALKLAGAAGFEVENFEEVLHVSAEPSVTGRVLNVVRVRMAPVSLVDNITWFKESIAPMITSQVGFSALSNMVDWETGRAISGSVFVNKECADASLAAIPERRAAAEDRGITFESINQREVLLSQPYQ
jgi:hypothetical protein